MKKLLVLALVLSAVSFGCSKKEEAATTETAPVETSELGTDDSEFAPTDAEEVEMDVESEEESAE